MGQRSDYGHARHHGRSGWFGQDPSGRDGESASSEALVAALRETEAARAEAEAANSAKDRFLAVLSHELRTPLTPVQLAFPILELQPALTDSGREALNLIRRNVEMEIVLIAICSTSIALCMAKLRSSF